MSSTPPQPASQGDALAQLYALELRSHLLESAAILDRLEAAGGSQDPRWQAVVAAAAIIVDGRPDRARRFQEKLSL